MSDESFGLSEKDVEVVRELTRRAGASSVSGMLSWWSEERRILWLRLFVGGRPGAWMMVPAADPREAARQREAFAQMVGIQLEVNAIARDAPVQ